MRQVGGVILIILGLNLAGILRIPFLERTYRPLDAGAAASMAGATGSVALASPSGGNSFADRLGGRLVTSQGGWLASFGLGAIFAIGWTPCIGVILGSILGMAISSGTVLQGGAPAGRLHPGARFAVPPDRRGPTIARRPCFDR